MSRNKLHDFTELLAQSQRLATQVTGVDQLKPIRKGIDELGKASTELGKAPDLERFGDSRAEQAAVRLFAQKTFDAEELNREVNSIHLKPKQDPLEKFESTDIDGFLAHHHDLIVLSALQEAKRSVEDDIQEMQRRWAAEEWSRAKRQFMSSLGLKKHTWKSSNEAGYKPESLQGRSSKSQPFSIVSSGQIIQPLPPYISKLASVVQMMAYASSEKRIQDPSAWAVRPAQEMVTQLTSIDPSVTGLNAGNMSAFRNCLEVLSAMTGEQEAQPKPCGYFAPLTIPPSSEINSKGFMAAAEAVVERKKLLGDGTRRFLERQFETILWNKVQQGVQNGLVSVPPATSSSNARLSRLRAFATLCARNSLLAPASLQLLETPVSGFLGQSAAGSDMVVPVWLLVYLCLRCGSIRDALTVLKGCWDEVAASSLAGLREDVENCVVVLEALLTLGNNNNNNSSSSQGNSSSSSSALVRSQELDLQLLFRNIELCRVEFREHQHRLSLPQSSQHASVCPYRALVLNLLGLADLDAISSVVSVAGDGSRGLAPGGTLEDFLWGGLWMADWSSELLRRSQLTASSGQGSVTGRMPADMGFGQQVTLSGSPCPSYSTEDIYKRIESVGGDTHFDQNRSTPFKYVSILLTLQKFGVAVDYLWRVGRVIESIHIASVCLYYGIIAPHAPLGSNSLDTPTAAELVRLWSKHALYPSYPLEHADYGLCLGAMARSGSSFLSAVIIGPDYGTGLDRLRDRGTDREWLERVCLLSLQAQGLVLLDVLTAPSTPTSQLVGELSPNGVRTEGHLDRHLDRYQVEQLLCQAGQLLIERDGNPEGALQLFTLAGRYAEVLHEIISQIVAVFNPSNPRRGFWLSIAHSFFDKHLRSGDSSVLRKLEELGRIDIVQTFQTLLNLCLFMDLSGEGRWSDASGLLDQLHIFPGSSAEVVASLPPSISKVLDDVLIRAMEVLLALYGQVQAQGGSAQTRQSRIDELRRRASGLVAFAGLDRSRLSKPDTVTILARMETTLV